MTTMPTLRTARLVLRPFEPSDARDVQRLAGAREIYETTLNVPHPYADGLAEAWIEGRLDAYERGEEVNFAITTLDATLIGSIGMVIQRRHASAELGYWIGVPFWGRGHATEAARAVIAYGFDARGLQRIFATYMPSNRASGRVLEKAGMTREGVLRQNYLKDGVPRDSVICSILRHEHVTEQMP